MARIITDLGIESLENRQVFFRNNKPVNMPGWEDFKLLPEKCFRGPVQCSKQFIEETFNEIIESLSGRVVNTSMDRFTVFCEENNLEFHLPHGSDFVTIRLKKLTPWPIPEH